MTAISNSNDFTESVSAGANALKTFLQGFMALANETCDQFGDDEDGRDYVALADMLECSFRANVIDAKSDHREGYLRALVDLLCIDGDGFGRPADDEWDPLATTEAAFARHRIGMASGPNLVRTTS